MRKFIKNLVSYLLATICVFGMIFGFAGCEKKADSFTEEEHIQRITERLEKKIESYDDEKKEKYSKFEVYPLYNQNEELKYFLIEYESYGFAFVMLKDERTFLEKFDFAFSTSMYVNSSGMYGQDRMWSPYIRDESYSQPYPDNDKAWICDEEGARIYYANSPYFVTGNINERKYLIQSDSCAMFICAVKKDGKFINLISGDIVSAGASYKKEATLDILFINNGISDL